MLELKDSRREDAGPAPTARSYELSGRQQWYVAQTLHNRESLARLHLDAQGYRSFFPRFRKTIRHARKLRDVVVPVFRGYVFVIIDDERDSWRAINGTVGVERLLTMQGRPIPVPRGIVDALVDSIDPGGMVRLGDELTPGQTVRLVAGPFAGGLGVLDRLDANGRVRVLLDIMGGRAPILMDRANLSAA